METGLSASLHLEVPESVAWQVNLGSMLVHWSLEVQELLQLKTGGSWVDGG